MEATLTQQEGLSAKDGLALYNETLGDPKLYIKEGKFLYLARVGKIEIVGEIKKQKRTEQLYGRESIIAHATHTREMATDYMVIRDAIAYVQEGLKATLGQSVEFGGYELISLVKSEELPVRIEGAKGGQKRLFKRADLDIVISKVIERKRLELEAQGLMDTRAAVGWINARLVERGDESYNSPQGVEKLLDRFYHWLAAGLIEKKSVPGKSGESFFWRYYFTEEALQKAPCFNEVERMPKDVKPIMVMGTKQMRQLEEQWGELITKRGAFEEGLSRYAMNKKERVRPVGFMGPSKIYPARYIPKKRRSPHSALLDTI